jgi:hypothetical protein
LHRWQIAGIPNNRTAMNMLSIRLYRMSMTMACLSALLAIVLQPTVGAAVQTVRGDGPLPFSFHTSDQDTTRIVKENSVFPPLNDPRSPLLRDCAYCGAESREWYYDPTALNHMAAICGMDYLLIRFDREYPADGVCGQASYFFSCRGDSLNFDSALVNLAVNRTTTTIRYVNAQPAGSGGFPLHVSTVPRAANPAASIAAAVKSAASFESRMKAGPGEKAGQSRFIFSIAGASFALSQGTMIQGQSAALKQGAAMAMTSPAFQLAYERSLPLACQEVPPGPIAAMSPARAGALCLDPPKDPAHLLAPIAFQHAAAKQLGDRRFSLAVQLEPGTINPVPGAISGKIVMHFSRKRVEPCISFSVASSPLSTPAPPTNAFVSYDSYRYTDGTLSLSGVPGAIACNRSVSFNTLFLTAKPLGRDSLRFLLCVNYRERMAGDSLGIMLPTAASFAGRLDGGRQGLSLAYTTKPVLGSDQSGLLCSYQLSCNRAMAIDWVDIFAYDTEGQCIGATTARCPS